MPPSHRHPSGPEGDALDAGAKTEPLPRAHTRAPGSLSGRARRQRVFAFGLLALALAGLALLITLSASGPSRTGSPKGRTGGGTAHRAAADGPFAVGLRVQRLVDHSRSVTLADGTSGPRTLPTYIRYPAVGAAGATDVRDAPAARASGPFPLVVFGHGFDVAPDSYARLLVAWARAGYVVAAPAFPLENPRAPGGPDESDLVNQPGDVRFVISRLLAASGAHTGPLAGLIDPTKIAVSGHSDGGDTALAVGYDPRQRDSRVSAVVVLSGAQIPGSEFGFPAQGPPLLATQGTADTVNPPSATNAFFRLAHKPKYLLELLGAEHLPPYSTQQPQLEIVTRVTTAFLDAYLKREPSALARLRTLGDVPGKATLLAEP